MKSLLVSVFWPTWEWIRYPSRRWIFASYSEALSLKHSLDRRTLLQSDWYQARWGVTMQLASDQNVKGEFQNTQRGVMIATSVSGSITGKGGDRIVVDDLHNPQQAESEAQRETALTYFRQTLSTRLDHQRTGATVVVMQRLHERDLSAVCLELGYTHVCLPAAAETLNDDRVSTVRSTPDPRTRRPALASARGPGRTRDAETATRFRGVRGAIPAATGAGRWTRLRSHMVAVLPRATPLRRVGAVVGHVL
jgi:hypothetical protein